MSVRLGRVSAQLSDIFFPDGFPEALGDLTVLQVVQAVAIGLDPVIVPGC